MNTHSFKEQGSRSPTATSRTDGKGEVKQHQPVPGNRQGAPDFLRFSPHAFRGCRCWRSRWLLGFPGLCACMLERSYEFLPSHKPAAAARLQESRDIPNKSANSGAERATVPACLPNVTVKRCGKVSREPPLTALIGLISEAGLALGNSCEHSGVVVFPLPPLPAFPPPGTQLFQGRRRRSLPALLP